MKGIIALDIDGTITATAHSMPARVVRYLEQLPKQGWELIFITGRSFQWAYSILRELTAPYVLAIQNGAIELKMPAREILCTKYLERSVLPKMEQICCREKTGFIVYAGYEHDDLCYFCSKDFTPETLEYLNRRREGLEEVWIDLPNFDALEIERFASLKCIGKEEPMFKISAEIEKSLRLPAPPNRDPFDNRYFVTQVTHPLATKGHALESTRKLLNWNGPVIAAGDDYNDISMLQKATIKVVMANAPREIAAMADIMAPPASREGIIVGLNHAIAMTGVLG